MVRNSPITQLTEETFEDARHIVKRSSVIDLKDVSFIDPYGMVGILEIGEQSLLEGVTGLHPMNCSIRQEVLG